MASHARHVRDEHVAKPFVLLGETRKPVGPDCETHEQKTENGTHIESLRNGDHQPGRRQKHHGFLQSEFFHTSSGSVDGAAAMPGAEICSEKG